MSVRTVVNLVFLGLCGCGDFEPTVGPPLANLCVNEDSDPTRDVSLARDLQPILLGELGPPGCGCHIPTQPDPIGFQTTGLDLSTYEGLRRGGTRSGSDIVIPGQPCQSIIFLKTGEAPPFGSRMPFNGPPVLSPEQRQLLADWIAEGADDD